MTRDNIISELFLSKEFNDCIQKMEPKHLQDDLRSEVMLILCEKEESFIVDLHSRGPHDLKRYVVAIILNQIKSNTSPFYKKFRGNDFHLGDLASGDISDTDHQLSDRRKALQGIGLEAIGALNEDEARTVRIHDRLTEEKKNELRLMEVYNLMPKHHYEMNLFLEYLELGTLRRITERIGIPHNSAHDTIKRAIRRIDQVVDLRILRKQPYDFAEIMEYITHCDRLAALDQLNNVLDYYKGVYPFDITSEIKRRISEKENRFHEQELQKNIA